MDAGDRPQVLPGMTLLAGLEAGMAGVVLMLGWLSLASLWNRHPAWTTVRLMATNFYGESALHAGFGRIWLAGIAVYLALYSALGALFALGLQGRVPRLRPAVAGVVWGLAWYYILFGIAWKQLNPLITLYTHDSPMLVGHILYGALLGRYPRYLRRLLAPAGVAGSPVPPAA